MSRSHDLRLAVSLGLLAGLPQVAQAALSFNGGLSTIVYEHDVIEGGTINRVKLQPTPAIQNPSTVTYVLPDLTLTGSAEGIGTLKSRAKVGFAQNTTSTTGTGLFKSGSLLTQADPGNLSGDFSTLTIGFELHWDVTAPGFGAPIIGSFSVPLLAVVGTGGSATAEIIDMHWERFDGFTTTDLRAPASSSITFLPGSTLTTLTIPGAAFSPASLTTGDDMIVRGTVKLAVKNADDPVSITIDPDYAEMIIDDGAAVHYRFEDAPIGNPLPGQAIDSATLNGQTNANYAGSALVVPGIRGGALRPNNVDTFIDAAIPSSVSFTAEVWVLSDTPNWNAPGWLLNSNSANAFALQTIMNTTLVEAFIYDNSGNPFSIGVFDAGPFDLTKFHHYALSLDNNSIARLFFDGVEVLNQDMSLVSLLRDAGTPMNIRMGFGSEAGLGIIDEFAYYEFALRPEQILSHFQLGSSNPDSFARIIGAVADSNAFGVPEPATAGLIGLAMMGLLARRRGARE